MVWFVELALLLVGVALLVNLVGGRARTEQVEDLRVSRIAAYAETIRRTKSPDALDAMSDSELADVLYSASRRLQADRNRRSALAVGAAVLALIVAIFFGANEGLNAFVIAAAIGAITVFGIDRALDRHTNAWIAAMGLERDRLAVD